MTPLLMCLQVLVSNVAVPAVMDQFSLRSLSARSVLTWSGRLLEAVTVNLHGNESGVKSTIPAPGGANT